LTLRRSRWSDFVTATAFLLPRLLPGLLAVLGRSSAWRSVMGRSSWNYPERVMSWTEAAGERSRGQLSVQAGPAAGLHTAPAGGK
jgi:hypothetical protein